MRDYLNNNNKDEAGLHLFCRQYGYRMAAEDCFDHHLFEILGKSVPDIDIPPTDVDPDEKLWSVTVEMAHDTYEHTLIKIGGVIDAIIVKGCGVDFYVDRYSETLDEETIKAYFLSTFEDFLKEYLNGSRDSGVDGIS